jgi:two-component system cell cycle sensor histidine kinase/response regulator CckA
VDERPVAREGWRSWWGRLARVPRFEDEEARSQAELLRSVLFALAGGITLISLATALFHPAPRTGLLVNGGALAGVLVAWVALRRGRRAWAARLAVGDLLFFTAVAAAVWGRVDIFIVLSALLIAIVAPLLLGRLGTAVTLVVTALSLLCLKRAEQVGLFGPPGPPPGPPVELAATVAFLAATGAIVLAARLGLQKALRRSRESRRELEESEFRYRSLIENAPIGVATLDRNLDLLSINRKGLELVGAARPADLIGRNVRELAIYRLPGSRGVFERILAGSAFPGTQYSWVTSFGKTVDLWIGGVPTRDAEGRINGALLIWQDLSDRLRLEEQLRQAQKMEAVGQLAGGVAHDFNNYLTVILGSADELANLGRSGVEVKALAQEIELAAERSADLTQQLLAFSRKQVMRPRAVDLNELLGDVQKMLRRVLGENIDLELARTSACAPVLVDPACMEQVIVNLALNARDAMPDGGRLTLETADLHLEADDALQYPEIKPGPHVLLAVSDTGVGIPLELRDRVFEPFFSTKDEGRGTGLGLSTVYGIVRQSGGTISLDSAPGRGSSFRILLPRAEAAPEGARRASLEEDLPGGNETVLLVEDNEMVRGFARRVLEGRGYCVLSAPDARRAQELAERSRDPIQLLLTDVMLSRMGGPELASRLLRRQPGLRVLYISGYSGQASAAAFPRDGLGRVLAKPFTARELLRAVRGALDG